MAGETRRPRILVVTTNFPLARRGDRTGNFVHDPVLALADEADQTVLMPNDARVGAPRQVLAGTVRVHRFAYWWPRRHMVLAHGEGVPANLRDSWLARLQLPTLLLAFLWHVWRHARDHDVVHAHWIPLAVLAWPVARLRGRPLAVTLHGTDVTQFPDAFVRWGLRRCDVVVSAHDDLLAEAARLAPEVERRRIRHLVEPQPVDDGDLADVRDRLGDGPVALFVARLSPERDPVSFVRAAVTTLEMVPDARFAVVGDGSEREAVDRAVEELGLADRVVRFGHRPDVWTFLRVGDAFAALSDRTNVWVTALVEAMRAGVPVVATTAGITADTLDDEQDALLVPVGDAEAIGRALGRLLADRDLARQVADGARATLDREGFHADLVRRQTLDLYRELAARTRSRRQGPRAG